MRGGGVARALGLGGGGGVKTGSHPLVVPGGLVDRGVAGGRVEGVDAQAARGIPEGGEPGGAAVVRRGGRSGALGKAEIMVAGCCTVAVVTGIWAAVVVEEYAGLRLRTTGDDIDFSPSSRAHDRRQCVVFKVVCRGGAVFFHVAAFVQSCVVIDVMSLEAASRMDIDGEVGRDGLSTAERTAVAATVCYAMGCGAFPRATPRWWMKRRTGGTWEDLRQCDDMTDEYFKDKLRMLPCVFCEIAETLSPLLQRRVTLYRVPLQPDHIIAYALYRWVMGETYDSGTCSFGIGRSSSVTTVRDVTAALLTAYPDKISWPTGLQKTVVLRGFAGKGFRNCHGCIDCTHIYIDKPANANGEDYYDRKRRFSVQAQVVVDMNLRVLDVFVG
ncbi:hypothetical protein CBR_g50199 [Chara braunii]|uniref:DDE Tnp4 domain-containing protein n=1 Tax=Chara braunii TaxID=69332 RepID=A0A388M688_CHABU|nr:hypothetical protein CBR_g50199 [Chara braunii]|eukprot:GBG90107.1 hypothetical protein CBR_g50199 [Chara braunii]